MEKAGAIKLRYGPNGQGWVRSDASWPALGCRPRAGRPLRGDALYNRSAITRMGERSAIHHRAVMGSASLTHPRNTRSCIKRRPVRATLSMVAARGRAARVERNPSSAVHRRTVARSRQPPSSHPDACPNSSFAAGAGVPLSIRSRVHHRHRQRIPRAQHHCATGRRKASVRI